ncbi:MAG: ThuA domain-containing protein [Chloroflexi bacterium]|nr:ThuA domain-containing protein [Chloroflexota bacterium]
MIKTAVITGGHHFSVIAFQHLFRQMAGIDAYVQHMADFVTSSSEARAEYNVLVFYTHLKHELVDMGPPPGQNDTVQSVVEALGKTPQGIVMLHHSLLAFPTWQAWDQIVGITNRQLTHYAHHEAIPLNIVDPQHPIMDGLKDWTITDETYRMPDAIQGDNHILMTTTHPKSVKTIAWTRQYKASRVFCLQLGDNAVAWEDANFAQLLRQGIQWSSGD